MNAYIAICVLSALVVLSYILDIISQKIRVPSVILLIILGIGLGEYLRWSHIDFSPVTDVLPALGNFGLILIVLEGALDLEITKENRVTAIKTLVIALVILVLTALAISYFFQIFFGVESDKSLLQAIPLAVISSAVAIPSVERLRRSKKEFIIFESTYSDILGIMFFNFVLANTVFDQKAFGHFFQTSLFTLIGSILGTFLLIFLMYRIKYHVKFFMIIAVLAFIFALGKLYHLSTLMIIFFFGLMLNNYQHVFPKSILKRMKGDTLAKEVDFMSLLTAESAFVIRTFFFIFFGMTISIRDLLVPEVLFAAMLIIVVIYFIRMIGLLLMSPKNLFPETFIAPRGLITILLIMGIPAERMTSRFDGSLYLAVIVASMIVLALSNIFTKKPKEEIDIMASNTPFIGPMTEEQMMKEWKSD